MCLLISVIRRRGAVAIYQFTSASETRDISGYVNPPAKFIGVYFSRGPGNEKGAVTFRGTSNSFVIVPNNGCLDTKNSMTIIFWLYPRAPGPLLLFSPKGVFVAINRSFKLVAGFRPRSGKSVTTVRAGIPRNQWSYIAITYDHLAGLATVLRDSVSVAQTRIGRFRFGLATNYPILIGRRPRDRRYFHGEISCLQIYNYAMDGVQIRSKMTSCFTPGLYELPLKLRHKFYHRAVSIKLPSSALGLIPNFITTCAIAVGFQVGFCQITSKTTVS